MEKGLAKAKGYNFYRRELRPLFVDVYHDSDSEDEREVERREKEAKAKLKEQRKAERKEKKALKAKILSESQGGDDDAS